MDPDEGAFSRVPIISKDPVQHHFTFLRPLQINSVCCIFKTNLTTFMARKTTSVGGFLAATRREESGFCTVSDTLQLDSTSQLQIIAC